METVAREETRELELGKAVSPFEKRVNQLQIISAESFETAEVILAELKKVRKGITEYWKDIKANAKKVHSEICGKENDLLEKVDNPQKIIETKMRDWTLAEKKRIADENAKAIAEAEKLRQKEEAKLDKKIEKAEEAGDIEKVEALQEKKDAVVLNTAPEIQHTQSRVGNSSVREKKKVEIIDKGKFIKAILAANENAAIEMIGISQSKLDAYVKANSLDKFDGLSITDDVSFSTRTK